MASLAVKTFFECDGQKYYPITCQVFFGTFGKTLHVVH